jgi:hypothetical protein
MLHTQHQMAAVPGLVQGQHRQGEAKIKNEDGMKFAFTI